MIQVHVVPKQEWAVMAENAHLAIFGEHAPATQERVDFALLCVDVNTDDPLSYVTCKELSTDTVYWSYGGAFPTAQGSLRSWQCYQAMHLRTKGLGYKTIFTLVENTNRPMLKFAAKQGYKIIGLRHVDGSTMLEHVLEQS